MRRVCSESGFTVVETMIAVMILVIGIVGVGAMQLKALQGTKFAGVFYDGANTSTSWLEWINNFVNQPDQVSLPYNGRLLKRNFVRLSQMDTNPNDTGFTTVELPVSTTTLLNQFNNTYDFKNADGNSFAATQVPPPASGGGHVIWRVASNVPAPFLTTVEVSCRYVSAIVKNQESQRMRMVFSPEL